jgi:PhnB protein
VTPYLVVRGAEEALEFYGKAFGARTLMRMPGPDGKLMHAEMKIGDSVVMLGDENPERGAKSPQTLGGSAGSVMLYVKDCDRVHEQAVAAGAKSLDAPQDMFWGDRYGKIEDPFGHQWGIATAKENVPPRELKRRMAAMGQG